MQEFINAIQSAPDITSANQAYYAAAQILGYCPALYIALQETVTMLRA